MDTLLKFIGSFEKLPETANLGDLCIVDGKDYVYTNTYYGSCSGCDTLQAISGYDDGLPNEEQVKDYMQLALNLLQKCKRFEEGEQI